MGQLRELYASASWRVVIGVMVLVNSIVLGLLTEVPEKSVLASWLAATDQALVVVLVLDAALCIAIKRWAVFHSGWDIFDITVTLVSVAPHFTTLSALRVLRVVRVLRLISFIPHGRAMVDAMLGALRNMSAAFVIMAVVFYSFVIIATNLFREVDPLHYGTLGRSAMHLYTVMVSLGSNLDTEMVLDGMPWALLMYAAFIIIASFGLMNMFIAVLVAALKEQLEQQTIQDERARFDRLERKVDAVAQSIEALRGVPGLRRVRAEPTQTATSAE